MKFISTYPSLKVLVRDGISRWDNISGKMVVVEPAIYAQFKMGIYETTSNTIINLMIRRVVNNKQLDIKPTFSVHPLDEEQAGKIAQKYIAEMDDRAGNIDSDSLGMPRAAVPSEEPNATAKALADAMAIIEGMKTTISELSEKIDKKEEKKSTGKTKKEEPA